MKRKLIDRARSGGRFIQRFLRQAAFRGGTRTCGQWRMFCQKPVLVTDPDKLKHYLQQERMKLPHALYTKGRITHKELDAYLTFASRELKRVFDSVLYGGGQKWATGYSNIVVNEGLDLLLDVTLSNATQSSTWYIGLLAASPTPNADWTDTGGTGGGVGGADFLNYDEANLVTWADDGVSSQSVTNSTTADFTVSADSSSIGGGFLIDGNQKNPPSGNVYAAGAFDTGNKAADDDDVLQVTGTFTTAAA